MCFLMLVVDTIRSMHLVTLLCVCDLILSHLVHLKFDKSLELVILEKILLRSLANLLVVCEVCHLSYRGDTHNLPWNFKKCLEPPSIRASSPPHNLSQQSGHYYSGMCHRPDTACWRTILVTVSLRAAQLPHINLTSVIKYWSSSTKAGDATDAFKHLFSRPCNSTTK